MIGENIKRFRKAKGISQQEMAEKLHVVRQTVSKWESGRSVPDADVLLQIAALLGVTAGQLLGTGEESAVAALSEELLQAREQLPNNSKGKAAASSQQKKRADLTLSFWRRWLLC